MTFRTRLAHRVDIEHSSASEELDRYGNPTVAVQTTEGVAGWFAWNSTSEDNSDRELRTSVATLIVGPEVSIAAEDRVVFEGSTFQVDGRPMEAWDHHGLHHRIVPLKVYEG